MSLCIAKIIDGEIHINADSLISGPGIQRHNPTEHSILKAVILNVKWCLAFAGVVDYVNDIIEDFYSGKFDKMSDFVHYLHDIHTSSNGAVDFILAGYGNNNPTLFAIKDGRVSSNQKVAWIGSKRAFTRFQQSMIGKKNLNSITFENSFSRVIGDDTIEEVGNFQFSIYTVEYQSQKILMYRPLMSFVAGNSEKNSKDFIEKGFMTTEGNSKENGDFAIHYIPSISTSMTGIGLFFGFVGYGLLFAPKLSGVYPLKFSKVDADMFVEEAQKRGMKLMPGVLNLEADNFFAPNNEEK